MRLSDIVSANKNMGSSPLCITLFGIGAWGARIAGILRARGVTLDVVDVDTGRRDAAMEVGARSFDTRPRVAADSRGLIIATPSTTHFTLIRELVDRGLPIFVEKPLTADLSQARQLAGYRDRPIFVMHTWLYHPGIELITDLCTQGELGELLYLRTQRVNWTSPRKDVDAIWTLLPHDLTIIGAVLGYIPQPRVAVAEMHGRTARGLVCVLGEQPHVLVEISNRYWHKGREVRAHFTNGCASLRDEATAYLEIVHGDHLSEPGATRVTRRPFSLEPDPLSREIDAFLGFLNGAAAPRSTLEEGVAVVEQIDGIRRLAGIGD